MAVLISGLQSLGLASPVLNSTPPIYRHSFFPSTLIIRLVLGLKLRNANIQFQ